MKIIIGLGNPGNEYKFTKHNIGFLVIDYLIKKNNLILDQKKFNGIFTKIKLNNQDVILAKPMTYMNLSGEFVQKIVNYYNISNDDILVIYDDISIDLGRIKITKKGSSGGHNGIKNIIDKINTTEFKRIKIGINNIKDRDFEIKKIVLTKFDSNEIEIIEKQFEKINKIIVYFVNNEIEKAMNEFN